MEHRWGRREEVTIPVELRWPQRYGAARGEITNVSTSGAWIDTVAVMPLLAPIEVDMLDVDGLGPLAAFVVRRSSRGIGVEWSELAQQRFELLHDGVEHLRTLPRSPQYDASLV